MPDSKRQWVQGLEVVTRSPWSRKAAIGFGTFVALTLITGVQYLTPRL